MGKETTRTEDMSDTQCRRGNWPQKGHRDAWEGAAVQEPASVPKGITEANKGKGPEKLQEEACLLPEHVGAEIARPGNTVHKHQTPRKISREASRTKALSIADRSRICFGLHTR